ncbi:Unknown protein sequence [Pseudomonas amygdali pv. photiniae]|uniref:Uncharacterized protein n=1 Tax=Pseudomonas amygdali pv. photiniae TaxID=251724 RepID=A0A0P9VA69_PSEA0|nr:Unknown protein sequence [Pseudomonas amygdali pv. photiniae]
MTIHTGDNKGTRAVWFAVSDTCLEETLCYIKGGFFMCAYRFCVDGQVTT